MPYNATWIEPWMRPLKKAQSTRRKRQSLKKVSPKPETPNRPLSPVPEQKPEIPKPETPKKSKKASLKKKSPKADGLKESYNVPKKTF